MDICGGRASNDAARRVHAVSDGAQVQMANKNLAVTGGSVDPQLTYSSNFKAHADARAAARFDLTTASFWRLPVDGAVNSTAVGAGRKS